jgi:hypothetical protein
MVNEGLTASGLIPIVPIMHLYEAKFVDGNWPVEKRAKRSQIGAERQTFGICAH